MKQEHLETLVRRMSELQECDPLTLNDFGRVLQGVGLVYDRVVDLTDPTDVFGDVLKFHRKMGIAYKGKPRLLPPDLQKFRSEFKKEELEEYLLAVDERDGPKQIDACIDLMVVLTGTLQMMGVDGREAWRRVQASNMTKRKAERPEESKRGYIGDVIKPEGWVAPIHDDLMEDPK